MSDEKIDWKKFRDSQRKDFSKKKSSNNRFGSKFGGNKGGYQRQATEKRRPPAWKLRMRDNKLNDLIASGEPIRVRLLPNKGSQQWYPFRSKWVTNPEGKKRLVMSNSWDGQRPVPCVLDYYCQKEENEMYWAGEQSEKYAISVLVLEDFYKISNTSRNGYEYFTYEKVPSPDRLGRIAHKPGYESHEIVHGRLLWWDLWDSQRKALMEKLEEASEKCANCGEGEISVYGYFCSNCNNPFADYRETEPVPEEEEQLRSMKVECEECGHYGMAEKMLECVVGEGYGSSKTYRAGCDNPTPSSWTDCDIILKATTVGNRVAYDILSFEGESSSLADLPDWMKRPMDFDYFLGRQDLDEQAKSIGKPNPFDESAQRELEKYFETKRDEEDQDSVPWDSEDEDDGDVF